jgi:hypothetical protein
VDPVVVFRPSKTAVGRAVTETMTYQEAVKSGVVLGNELELEVEALLGCITLLGGPYIVVRPRACARFRDTAPQLPVTLPPYGPGRTTTDCRPRYYSGHGSKLCADPRGHEPGGAPCVAGGPAGGRGAVRG